MRSALLSLCLVVAAAMVFVPLDTPNVQAQKAPDKLEIEKKLLTVPDNPLDPAWQAAWVKYLGVAVSPRARNDFNFSNAHYAIVLTNNSPCTIKLSDEYLGTLTKDGNPKSKETAPWTIPPGKSLYVGVKPKLPTAAVKNDLAGKPIFSLSLSLKPMCQIEILPEKSDLKPLTLNIIMKYGADQFDRYVAGERAMYRPEDEEQVLLKLGVKKAEKK